MGQQLSRKYVIYGVSKEEMSSIPPKRKNEVILCEIWSELPPFSFAEVPAGGGKKALRAEGDGLYVYVPPSTVDELEKRRPLLRAFSHPLKGAHFFWVEPIPANSYEDVFLATQAFNKEQLSRARIPHH
ncbi:MAG: hypothetical protein P4L67_01360 [Candidatus Pacebacteria bacterium]|nr:hypothetical protein [Candidatus Paceibacterota bacterium]